MLFFSALVAGSFSLGGMAAREMDPAAFSAVRFWLAAVFVGLLALSAGGIARESFRAPWRYLVLGGLFGLYFVLMFEGLKTAPPVSAAAVFTLAPIMAAGFAWLLLRQILTLRMAVALTVGGLGALWVIFRADFAAVFAFDVGHGEFIYFVGCVSHALYTPMVKWVNRGESAVISTLGTVIAGGVILSIYAAPTLRTVNWSDLPGIVWITLFYTAFFATACTVVLLQFAAVRLPSAKVMAYTYLVPTWVILWEVALGNALPPALVMGGIALTIAALLMLLRDESKPAT